MSANDASKEEQPKADDEDDWTKYADANYASEYDPWADMVEADPVDDEEFDEDEFEEFDEGEPPTHDIPRAPAPNGIAHLVQIGICNHCLARVSGMRQTEPSMGENGAVFRANAETRDPDLTVDESVDCCPFCEDLFADVPIIADRICAALADVEFSLAQLGSHFAKDHVQAEEEMRTRFAATGSRPLKTSLVEQVQKAVVERMPGVNWVKEKPEVMVLFDTLTLGVRVDIRGLFLYGRYRKLSREIPQTRWPCRSCRGRDGGCDACEGTGRQYQHTIQDLVGDLLTVEFQADDNSFHGMGREDIDVRCLGSGRPFVVELKSPRRRSTDLDALVEKVNAAADGMIEITGLRPSNKPEVARIKETKAEKSYTIFFRTDADCGEDEIRTRIESLSGKVLEQRTPQRVSHRRADMVRKRKVISIGGIKIGGDEIRFRVRCESGTYVKELVHSDEGRTTPSVAGLLEAECEVIRLDVEDIHAD